MRRIGAKVRRFSKARLCLVCLCVCSGFTHHDTGARRVMHHGWGRRHTLAELDPLLGSRMSLSIQNCQGGEPACVQIVHECAIGLLVNRIELKSPRDRRALPKVAFEWQVALMEELKGAWVLVLRYGQEGLVNSGLVRCRALAKPWVALK